jgi:flagellar basal-body rod protein FlgB
MDLGKLPLFSMMTERLAWLGKRQQVLAHNVANADTPGYMARDLKAPNFREMLGQASTGRIAMAQTTAKHIAPAGASKTDYKSDVDKDGEFSLSGNSVDIEEQMMKVAQTAMDHQVTVNLYRKHIAMMKTALGRPGG